MNKLFSGIFLTVFSLQVWSIQIWCMEDHHQNSLYDLVLREHTPALDRRELPIAPLATATNDESRDLAQVSSKQMALSEFDRFKRVNELLKLRRPNSRRRAICPKTIQQLEILAGKNPDSQRHCVLAQFPTHTTSGKILLGKRLISLYTSTEITSFQELIKSFNNNANRANIRSQLEKISKSEQALLSLWTSNFSCVDVIKSYVEKRTPTIPVYGCVGTQNIGLTNATSADFENQAEWSDPFMKWLLNLFTQESAKSDAFIRTLQTLLQHKTAALFDFCDATHSIAKDLSLSNTSKEKTRLNNFLTSTSTRNLLALKTQLGTTTNPITKIGLYFQATGLLYSMKRDLLTTYKTLGTLDQISSIAHLFHTSPNPFCFAQFTGGTGAKLKLDDYWNCMLSGNIVKNSITVGPDEPHVVIVGGVNGTGKTTAIEAISLCEHLAATAGVVPARQCVTSKPAQIFTSINERDRLASQEQGGVSLFQAQVRALVDLIDKAKDNPGLSVMVIDEPCTATNTNNAKLAVERFFNSLSPMKQKIICLLTTHFEEIREFAKSEPRNYHLLFGHEDFTVNSNDGDGALDYGSVADQILRMFK